MAARTRGRGSGDGIDGAILETGVGSAGAVLEADPPEVGRRAPDVGNAASGAGAVKPRSAGAQEGFPRCRTSGKATGGTGVDPDIAEAPAPAVYLPYTLYAPAGRELAMRTAGHPLAIVNAVRLKVRDLDKDLAVGKPNTLDESLGEETQQPRFNMALFSSFAALGLALAAIGITA
jgi:hypothetical protein